MFILQKREKYACDMKGKEATRLTALLVLFLIRYILENILSSWWYPMEHEMCSANTTYVVVQQTCFCFSSLTKIKLSLTFILL